MDGMEEKLNGTPVMEIDEPVSVRDRESFLSCLVHQTSLYARIL